MTNSENYQFCPVKGREEQTKFPSIILLYKQNPNLPANLVLTKLCLKIRWVFQVYTFHKTL